MARALILIAAACALSACDAAAPVEPDDVAPPATDAAPAAPACVTDADCEGYLRCVERACRIPGAVSGLGAESAPLAALRAPDGTELVSLHLELAVDDAERARGLMFRETIAPKWGMLFVFPDERPLSFWMKNTLIPLDMIYIDAEGRVVSIIENAEPLSLEPRPSGAPARYCLEVAGGRAARWGVEPGATLSLTRVADPAWLPRAPQEPAPL